MKPFKNTSGVIKQLELRLQAMVEGQFARLLEGGARPHVIAAKLMQALEENTLKEGDALLCPDFFIVTLHNHLLEQLARERPNFAHDLSDQLMSLIYEAKWQVKQHPQVILVGDNTLPAHEVRVKAEHRHYALENTQVLDLPELAPSQEKIPYEAYLILEGGKHFPLERTPLTIGRDMVNHLVLESQAVSRQHCQLRVRYGRFVVFDLQSKGGTFVNGKRVQEQVLSTGDVISCSGIQMIYIEDREPDTVYDTQVD